MGDKINHPDHYISGGVETIDLIEAKDLNFNLGNVVKYVSRCGRKDNPIDDLKKAQWYLNREITRREAIIDRLKKEMEKDEDNRHCSDEGSGTSRHARDVYVSNTPCTPVSGVRCSRK